MTTKQITAENADEQIKKLYQSVYTSHTISLTI